jgi:aminoglycoside phosphotransferase (APT) family kinase protein
MNIANELSGRVKLRSSQRVLLSATAPKVLRDRLRALLCADTTLGPCRLRKVRFTPGRQGHEFHAYYDARVRLEASQGQGYRVRPIVVTWRSGTNPEGHDERVALVQMQAEAMRRGVAAPFLQLMADFPEWSLQIRVSPLDARFLQLVRVSDPRHVRAMLAHAYTSAEAASDQRGISEYTVTPMRYLPGRRHVLRYDPLDRAKGGTVFAKLYVGEDGARAFRMAEYAADWLAEHGEGVRGVRPLAYVAEDAVVLYPQVVGMPLSDRAQPPSRLAEWWRRAGAALCTLHHLPMGLADLLQLHDFAAEMQEIVHKSDHIRALLPQVGAAIDALLDRAREVHDRLPQEPLTFIHGDLTSKHIWLAASGLTLIDFDSSRLADPALDVGKFLADLQVRSCHQSELEEAHESFLAGYASGAPNERLLRARLYEAVELVKLAARRVHPFKRDWAFRTARLVRRAQAVINELQFALGLPLPAVGKRITGLVSTPSLAHCCEQQVSLVSMPRVRREKDMLDLSDCETRPGTSFKAFKGRGKSGMNIGYALSGRAKLQGIRWVLLSAFARKALRDRLKALLSTGTILGLCRLRKVRFTPGRELNAYYDARVQLEASGGYCVRPIVVTWKSATNPDVQGETAELAQMQAEAVRHGVAAPFLQLMADFPEEHTQIRVSPLDVGFIQLVRVSDPQHVRAMLANAYGSSSANSDQPGPSEYRVTPVHYLPGKRHVLRYDPADPAKGRTVFAKLYVGNDGARAVRVANYAADWLAEQGAGVNGVRPLAYVAEDAVVLYPRVVGKPLSDRTQRPWELAQWLRRAGAAICLLHQLPAALVAPLEFHDFAAEIQETAWRSDHVRVLLPQVGAAIDALLGRARQLHERLPQEPPTFTHGDLKSKHIWVTAAGLTIIDFDSSRLADPALDIGKFLADWQFWHLGWNQPAVEETYKSFLAGYAPGAPNERLLRARLYEAVELIKWTVLRVHPFEHDWASRMARLVERAHAVINDLHLTLGLPVRQLSVHGAVNTFPGSPQGHYARHDPSAREGGH